MKRSCLVLFALAALAGSAAAGGGGRLRWREGRTLDAALAEARATGTPVMLYFAADYCPGCKALNAGAFSDEGVAKAAEGWIRVLVDSDRDGRVFQRYKVQAMPTVLFLDPDGAVVGKLAARASEAVRAQLGELGVAHRRGPKVLADLETARATGRPVLVLLADDKPRSQAFAQSLGDPAYGDVFEKIAFTKLEFRKDGDEAKRWKVQEAPALLLLDVDGLVLRALKIGPAKALRRELEDALRAPKK